MKLRKSEINNIHILLIITFFTLVLVKALLSLRFQSPWLMPDEVTYAKMASDVFGPVHSELPRGYPLIISAAYLFSENMMEVYHSMLIINSLISSLIIFPSFFILNKYCPEDFSFVGAVTVATLPSLTLYSFLITTENLFVPLFVFSIWFLLEAYETEKPLWIALAISSVSLLFFSRHTGIFMMAALAVSLIYYLRSKKRYGDVRQKALRKRTCISFIVLFICSLALFGLALTGSERISYFSWLYNRASADGQIFWNIFKDGNLMKDYLVLLRNEVGYLIIASYFIFFYMSIIFFSKLFFISFWQNRQQGISNFFISLGSKKELALKTVGIYYLLAFVIFVLTTTMAAYRLSREIIGRYIDPVIPGIFLFGLIGLYHIHEASRSRKRDFLITALSAMIFSVIFFFSFPEQNQITIYHIGFLKNFAPNWIVFPSLALGFFLLLYVHKHENCRDHWWIFFAVLIILSVCSCAYTYNADLVYISDANNANNQIGAYLNEHSGKEALIVMDNEIAKKDWYFAALTGFWIKGKIVYQPAPENLSDMKSDKRETYLITSKLLPLPTEPLVVSSQGYYLYYV